MTTSADTRLKIRILWSAAAAVLLLFLLVGRCRTVVGPSEYIVTGATMGTTYTVKLGEAIAGERLAAIARAVDALLFDMNRVFSTYLEDSELSRFNRSDGAVPFPLSDDLLRVFEVALDVSRQTNGAFDVTVGPLVNAWGFGPDRPETPPSAEEVATLRERIGFEKLHLEDGALSKSRPDVYCDLSAVAKGYAVDRVAALLEAQGLRRFMVEIGGEVRTTDPLTPLRPAARGATGGPGTSPSRNPSLRRGPSAASCRWEIWRWPHPGTTATLSSGTDVATPTRSTRAPARPCNTPLPRSPCCIPSALGPTPMPPASMCSDRMKDSTSQRRAAWRCS
ncbi:MAG TPA: FAD:protein FMN transferase [Candidatus Hydrogenedentes bacterium]|nr:FAD:protein FMN transferase [Candidatus Hydrogenedentota bacterium]